MGKQGQRRVWMDRERKGLNFCFNRFVARSMSRGTKVLLPTIGIGVCSVRYSSFALKHVVSLENAVGRLWIKGERGVKGEGRVENSKLVPNDGGQTFVMNFGRDGPSSSR